MILFAFMSHRSKLTIPWSTFLRLHIFFEPQKYRMNIKVPGDGSMMESMDPDDEASGDETVTRKRAASQREGGKGGGESYHGAEGASPRALLQMGPGNTRQQQALRDPTDFHGVSLASASIGVATPHGVAALAGPEGADPAAAAAASPAAAMVAQRSYPSTSGATKGGNSLSTSSSTLNRKQLEEALLFQMELQKKLHDQLEVG